MDIKERILQILYRSGVNSSILFMVQDQRNRTCYIPLEEVANCMRALNRKNQRVVIARCEELQGNPERLERFFKRLAITVVNKRL